ncbi:ABC transporter permease [Marmoricola endophyticus]|uniref:ABC transporter permease n=1 Tax=Marmoricola endophyticus TaxID=2040280 RepID=A0A917BBS9_9ACTN|nr:iron ABC transporter permease [Marmoricola endophyticus]GGF32839.1 ABC transporter permease [Marmoricola endophyticus]
MTTTDERAVRAEHDREAALATLAVVRRKRLSRRLVVTIGLVVVAVAACLAALSVGDLTVSPLQVLLTLTGGGDDVSRLVLLEFRLPRLAVDLSVGVAFGLAGAMFQSVLRNPLASPDIIGVSQGASVGAVAVLLVAGVSGPLVPVGALVGAAAVAGLNLALAWRGGVSGYRFVLCGIALAFVASSILNYFLTRTDSRAAQGALTWIAGSTISATYADFWPVLVVVVVLLPAVLWLDRRLGLLEMGDQTAEALGVSALRTRLVAVLCGVVLAAVATAAAGPVAFVALISGPVARRLAGDGHPALPQAALVGMSLMALADLAAQYVLPDAQVPVGIVTGIIGGPYLVWLLATGSRRRSA